MFHAPPPPSQSKFLAMPMYGTAQLRNYTNFNVPKLVLQQIELINISFYNNVSYYDYCATGIA